MGNNPQIDLLNINSFVNDDAYSDSDIDFFQKNGIWYGYTPIRSGNAIIRYKLDGDLLADSLSGTNLGNLDNQINLPFGSDVQIWNDSIYLFVASWSNNSMIIYNMSIDPENNTPVWYKTFNLGTTSPNINLASSVVTHVSCEKKIVFVSGYHSSNVLRLNFNESSKNTPVISQINSSNITRPVNLQLSYETGVPNLYSQENEDYLISLDVESKYGCYEENSATIETKPKPASEFASTSLYGEIPLQINLEGDKFISNYWLLDGDTIDSSASTSVTIMTEAVGTISHYVIDESGCSSLSTKQITAFSGLVDHSLNDLKPSHENLEPISSSVSNLGNIPVYGFTIEYQFENGLSLSEHVSDTIKPGDQKIIQSASNYRFNDVTDFVCAEITDLNLLSDDNPINNLACYSSSPILPVFPNPTSGGLNLAYTDVDATNPLIINIYDSTGKLCKTFTYNSRNGLNKLELNLEDLSTGIFLLEVNLNNQEHHQLFFRN